MQNELMGWELIQGQSNVKSVKNPTVSQVISALEGLVPDQADPFMILVASLANGVECNYFQVFAGESDYCCESRIYEGAGFRHGRAFLPDEEGELDGNNESPMPSLTQAVRMMSAFITSPDKFPELECLVWLDVSEEFI
jgi:hypothetical protein